MRSLTSIGILGAVAIGLTLAALPASAAMHSPSNLGSKSTMFDLGINVGGVPLTAKAVAAFLASKSPETRAAIMGGCRTYVQHPEDVRSIRSLTFCEIAVGV